MRITGLYYKIVLEKFEALKKTNPRSKGISIYILLAQPAQLYPSQVSSFI